MIWAATWENRIFAYAKTKTQISFAVSAKLISAFVFATWIVQSLCFLNPKFQVSSHLLWLYSLVCVGPGRISRRPVSDVAAHITFKSIDILWCNIQQQKYESACSDAFVVCIWGIDILWCNIQQQKYESAYSDAFVVCIWGIDILWCNIQQQKYESACSDAFVVCIWGIDILWCNIQQQKYESACSDAFVVCICQNIFQWLDSLKTILLQNLS